jgi:hypothetical protein
MQIYKPENEKWKKTEIGTFPLKDKPLSELLDELAEKDRSRFFLVFDEQEEKRIFEEINRSVLLFRGQIKERTALEILKSIVCGSNHTRYFPQFFFEGNFNDSPMHLAFWFNYQS